MKYRSVKLKIVYVRLCRVRWQVPRCPDTKGMNVCRPFVGARRCTKYFAYLNELNCEVMEKCMGEHFKAGNNLVINVIFMSTKESG